MSAAGDLMRPARPRDLAAVRRLIVDAIDESPYYSAGFKEHEKARLDLALLRMLIEIDPWHVALLHDGGAISGLALTIPEFGNLWSPWVYVSRAARQKALGLTMVRTMVRHWDHGRFHKVSCYVRPDNRTARAVYKRVGFVEVALLSRHILGEDVILMERPLTKTVDDYDRGLSLTRGQRLRLRILRLLGR